MINFECRAHPTMIFKIVKPYLFVLILPFIRAFVQYITIGKIKETIYFELLATGFVVVAAFCGAKAIKITVKSNSLIIEKGFLIKSQSVIDISRISSVAIKQNMFDALTKGVSCAINTEAGRLKRNDFNLKLYKTDAKLLYFLIFGTENTKKEDFSPFGIALLAVGTSSAATGLVIGIPIINKTGELIDVALTDVVIERISNFTDRFFGYLPPIINVITMIFIISYAVSFVVIFLKSVKFRLVIGEKLIKIYSGLITRQKIVFKKENINNICFEQNFIMRLNKRYSMVASIGGYGDNKGEKATIIPIARREILENNLKKQFKYSVDGKNKVSPNKNKLCKKRFLFFPTTVLAVTIAVFTIAVICFGRFNYIILLLSAVVTGVDIYYASVCYHNFKYSEICFDDTIKLSGSNKFTVKEMYCRKERVGIIKISQNPADKKFKSCKLKVIICSESSDSLKIKFLDLNKTVESINRAYNIKLDV